MTPENKDYQGLTSQQAEARLLTEGENCLPQTKAPGFGMLFLKQFKSPFIYVLLIAAVVSFLLDQPINGLFIFAVLLLNATIGSFQEYSAEKAAVALNALVPQMANVLRNGHSQRINSKALVTDDLVYLASGDKVPADGICLEAQQLTLDESMLTGESLAVLKSEKSEYSPPSETPQISNGCENICYAGTTVIRGRGLIKITATGLNTEIGKISNVISQKDTVKAPLLQRIERFTLQVTFATLIVISLIFIISLVRGEALTHVFFLGVALAVSAIPEGLPAAITVALAIGMRRMARKNVIIRSLLAVESLGSCTFIASDKTGTLTVNDMTVEKIVLPNTNIFEVKKQPTANHFLIGEEQPAEIQNAIRELCETGALCNEAELYFKDNQWQSSGDQVDIALLNLYKKAGLSPEQRKQIFPVTDQIPYESENAFSASLNRVHNKEHNEEDNEEDNQYRLSVKGSVEKLLPITQQTDSQQKAILSQVSGLAGQGYRVLALANKSLLTQPEKLNNELHSLKFVGLVAIIDPLREEASSAVKQCRDAQIQVAMITGDHPETAHAIASKLGIISDDEKVVHGEEISRLYQSSPEKLSKLVAQSHTFARVKPVEKKIIVEQLQQQGHFVAVTGDGVNDAPALKTAHVGISMGKRGTDVARESSDLILTDDNFASIINGIVEGRVVYANIRKVVFLLISTGAAEILLFILSLLAGLPLPLFPIQLLWLNLVTNGVQDVALAFEPAEGNELKKAPRPPSESIFNKLMIERVVINAIVMGSIAFCLFAFNLYQGMAETEARNLTLLLMVLFENVHALNSRSESLSLFKMSFFGNKLLLLGVLIAQGIHIGAMYSETLGNLLQLTPVSLKQWFNLLSIALILIVVDEAHKYWHRRKQILPDTKVF